MDRSLFKQLVESMSQMGEITRDERLPARAHVLDDDATSNKAINRTHRRQDLLASQTA